MHSIIFGRILINKQLLVDTDLHGMGNYKKSIVPINCLVTNILQNILVCVQQKKNSYRFGITCLMISVWYGNSSNQDCKALQRVVRLAECISGSALPSLQGIYLKRCKSRAAKIIKDSNHPGNRLFILLPSGKRFRSMMAKTERLRRSFFPQAIRLLNSNLVS